METYLTKCFGLSIHTPKVVLKQVLKCQGVSYADLDEKAYRYYILSKYGSAGMDLAEYDLTNSERIKETMSVLARFINPDKSVEWTSSGIVKYIKLYLSLENVHKLETLLIQNTLSVVNEPSMDNYPCIDICMLYKFIQSYGIVLKYTTSFDEIIQIAYVMIQLCRYNVPKTTVMIIMNTILKSANKNISHKDKDRKIRVNSSYIVDTDDIFQPCIINRSSNKHILEIYDDIIRYNTHILLRHYHGYRLDISEIKHEQLLKLKLERLHLAKARYELLTDKVIKQIKTSYNRNRGSRITSVKGINRKADDDIKCIIYAILKYNINLIMCENPYSIIYTLEHPKTSTKKSLDIWYLLHENSSFITDSMKMEECWDSNLNRMLHTKRITGHWTNYIFSIQTKLSTSMDPGEISARSNLMITQDTPTMMANHQLKLQMVLGRPIIADNDVTPVEYTDTFGTDAMDKLWVSFMHLEHNTVCKYHWKTFSITVDELIKIWKFNSRFMDPRDLDGVVPLSVTIPTNFVKTLSEREVERLTEANKKQLEQLIDLVYTIEERESILKSRLECLKAVYKSDKLGAQYIDTVLDKLYVLVMYMRGWEGSWEDYVEMDRKDKLKMSLPVSFAKHKDVKVVTERVSDYYLGTLAYASDASPLPLPKFRDAWKGTLFDLVMDQQLFDFHPTEQVFYNQSAEEHGKTIDGRINIIFNDYTNSNSCIRMSANVLAMTIHFIESKLGIEGERFDPKEWYRST